MSPNNRVGNRLFFEGGQRAHINTFCWSAFYGLGEKATPPIEFAPFKDEGQRSVASAAQACACGHVVSMYECFAVR